MNEPAKEDDMTRSADSAPAATEGASETLREEVVELRHRLSALEARVRALEVRESLVENPDASGDEPVRG